LRNYVIIGGSILLIAIVGVFYGMRYSAHAVPDFWRNFTPNLWANIIGVSAAAVIGVPVGLAINHYVVRITEQRHHRRQIEEVRQLLEQVRFELNLHFVTLARLSQIFTTVRTETEKALTLGADISTLVLQDQIGRQFMSNHSVLDVGESLVLLQVSIYYARIGDLNRLLTFRIQAPTPGAENWDPKIADMTDAVASARVQADYEIQQAVARLTGRGGING